jgi:preprotein translocase subunit SecA
MMEDMSTKQYDKMVATAARDPERALASGSYSAFQWDMHLSEAKQQMFRKVGRNEPCPCGSGKKWKRCCYLKL